MADYVYEVQRAPAPVVVDGRLDEAAWAAAQPIHLVDNLDGSPARYGTTARLLWDASHLYVAYE